MSRNNLSMTRNSSEGRRLLDSTQNSLPSVSGYDATDNLSEFLPLPALFTRRSSRFSLSRSVHTVKREMRSSFAMSEYGSARKLGPVEPPRTRLTT
eukprot:scaffold1659_cov255-Pinguiococcus_pyrenoidosus.AAC.12